MDSAMERRYGYGVGLVITGGLFLSTSGILLRNIEEASGWQILFYRGISFSLTLFLLLLLRYRSGIGAAFHAIGKPGIWAAVVLGLARRSWPGWCSAKEPRLSASWRCWYHSPVSA
jgi:hypothetical protein